MTSTAANDSAQAQNDTDASSTERLEARGASVAVDGHLLVQPLSLTLAPGELVALIGPSGAGKTTLLRALSGALPPYDGEVLLGGGPLPSGTPRIGYVPAEDLLHPELTVSEELLFAAALRAGEDTSDAELESRVSETLRDLRLTDLADARISTLSKGQRRRASCGVELVGRPGVLLLDEPAGGLDPQLERRLMEQLRDLADSGRGVLVATHATASLALCDRVIAFGQGGVLRFDGAPDELAAFFGATTVEEAYVSLESGGEQVPAPPRAARAPVPRERGRSIAADLRALVPRAAICRLRDTRTLAILLGQAPVLGLAIAVVLPRNVVRDETLGPFYGVLLSFMLLIAAIWLGTISASREIVRDQAVIRREAAVGVAPEAQLLARCLVVLPLVLLQTTLLSAVVLMMQPVGHGAALVVALAGVAGCAGACMGLWVSAWARTSDQATSTIPLVLIPQLLFAGALIPIDRMPAPLHALSEVVVGRWALSGLGGAIDLDERLGSTLSGVSGLEADFFAGGPQQPIAAMAAIGAACLIGAAVSLRRGIEREPR